MKTEQKDASGLIYMQARFYLPMYGRFTSPDPARDQHFEQTQSWNTYSYCQNEPLMHTDPTGLTTLFVTYTTGNSQGDEQFKQAAITRANEIAGQKGFDPEKDKVLVSGVRTKADFAGALKAAGSLDKKFGKIGEVDMFSYFGKQDGPVFHSATSNQATFLSKKELGSLNINWTPNAEAKFFGCNTGLNFAQSFANAQHVKTEGYGGYAYFSSDPTKRVDPKSAGPLYLINAHGYHSEGLSGWWEAERGRAMAQPMVEKEPQEGH